MSADVERLKDMHRKFWCEGANYCHRCGLRWPCDAVQLADAYAALAGRAGRLWQLIRTVHGHTPHSSTDWWEEVHRVLAEGSAPPRAAGEGE